MSSQQSVEEETDVSQRCVEIIAQAIDVSIEEIQDDSTKLADLGLDFLVAPTIIAEIFKETGLELAENVFQIFPDVGGLKHHVESIRPAAPVKASPEEIPLLVLMQGDPARATKNIFLLPDGSGSAMGYARIPAIGCQCCLYALNSPFLQKAANVDFTIEQLAYIWAQEITQTQAHGPYVFGGWSAGGYYAFEVMKHFYQMGEVVEKLILIDSPCRTDFEALPLDVVLFLSSTNMMGNWSASKTPDWVIRHFEATLRAVSEYIPQRIGPVHVMPHVFVIWASETLFGENAIVPEQLDLTVKVSRFLLNRRPNFGPNGWEKLFPGTDMRIATMPGNHFSIIHPPNVSFLGQLLRDVIQEEQAGWTNTWRTLYIPPKTK